MKARQDFTVSEPKGDRTVKRGEEIPRELEKAAQRQGLVEGTTHAADPGEGAKSGGKGRGKG